MALEEKKTLVLCVDRDNDLGRKTNAQGPVIGRNENLKAATKLVLADPGESDANCMFAAVKKFDELKKRFPELEIATITGHGKSGFTADKVLNEQLDTVLKKFNAESIILVTDGKEDDQIIPILQSRASIISKEIVIIKQAQVVESTYYTIREALKDPFLARIVFGIPGIILILFVALGTMSIQYLALVFGIYLLLKGFGIEERLLTLFHGITSSISTQRTSFPFYIGSLFILAFGVITAYNKFISIQVSDPLTKAVIVAQSAYFFIVLAALSTLVGRSIDSIHFKKAFRLRKYLLSGVSVLIIWFILDSGTLVFLRKADLNWFLFSVLISFVFILIAFRIASIMDVRRKVTKLLIGLPIYNKEGKIIGKVERIDRKKESILFTDILEDKMKEIRKRNFSLREGRIHLI